MDMILEPVSGSLSTATYPNRFNAVIPIEAPFFRTGLKVMARGQTQPLIEGLDYYLGYYYDEAANAFQDSVYGGIILLSHTEIDYEIVPVGQQYRIPSAEIGKWLVKTDLEDPRNVDWSELMRYAPTIPAIDPPADLEEARLRDDVVAALYELTETLRQQSQEMEGVYDECAVLLAQTGKKIYDDGLYQHHLIPNAHHYSGDNLNGTGMGEPGGTGTYLRTTQGWVETYSSNDFDTLLMGGSVPAATPVTAGDSCLMVAGKAVDATLAFGRTLSQMVTLMATAGIQQRDVDALMSTALGHLYGRLSVENGETLTYKTANDNHIIQISGGSILLKTKLRMDIIADKDNNEPGIAAEVGAGLNTLMVHSGPDAKAPVYNGAFLITPEQVSQYLHEVILSPANAYFGQTSTLTITGTAKKSAPVMMNATPPQGSTTVEGLVAVSNTITAAALPGTVLSQNAVTQVRDDLALYVDDTFTINGVSFNKTTQQLILTPTNIALGNVNNTAPADKPVSTALNAALALKSLEVHTHTLADLTNVPTASGTTNGMLQLHDAVDATTDKAVTSKQGYLLDVSIKDSEAKASVLLPAWAVIGSQYGKESFMPIPAMGNYEGYVRTGIPFTIMRRDGDYLYILRNGYNGVPGEEAVYYASSFVNADGTIAPLVQSSFRYHPQGLTDRYPGVVLKELRYGSPDCGVFLGDDGHLYLVLFDGSLDYRKHLRVVRFSIEQLKDPTNNLQPAPNNGEYNSCLVYNGDVYIIVSYLSASAGGSAFRMAMFRVAKEELVNTEAVARLFTLTGSRFKLGDWNAFFRDGAPATVEDPDIMVYVTPEGLAKWSGTRNVTHGPMAPRLLGVEGNLIRVGFVVTYYFSSPTGSRWGRGWNSSYLIDMTAKTVTLEGPERFPLRITDIGLYYKNDLANVTDAEGLKLISFTANNRVNAIEDDSTMFIAGTAQTAGTSVAIFTQAKTPGKSLFDYAKYDFQYAPAVSLNSDAFTKGFGSVYANSMAHPLFLGGDSKSMLLQRANNLSYCINCEYVTDKTYGYPGYAGFGPSNNRSMFSGNTYETIAGMALIKASGASPETLDGAKFTGPASHPFRTILGTPTVQPQTLNISQAVWDGLLAAVKAKMATLTGASNYYASEYLQTAEAAIAAGQPGKVLMTLWVIGVDAFSGSPLYLVTMGLNGPRDGFNRTDFYIFTVSGVLDASKNISFNTPNVTLLKGQNTVTNSANNGLGYDCYGGDHRQCQPLLTSTDGVNYVLYLPGVYGLYTVGGTAAWSWYGKLVKSGNSWTGNVGSIIVDTPQYTPNRVTYVKDLGGFVVYNFGIHTAILSGKLVTYDAWHADPWGSHPEGVPVVLGSMETASGWIMYITEEVYLYVKQKPIQVPQFEMDLSVAFPGNYSNQTFYVHVEGYLDAGVWKGRYIVGLVKLPDTDTRLYIGYVRTDANRIVELKLERVKRMGRVSALQEHLLNPNKHQVSEKIMKDFSPLGVLNRGGLDTFDDNGSYTSLFKASTTIFNPGRTCWSTPVPAAPVNNWTFGSNPVEKFWIDPETGALPAAQFPNYSALGMTKISFASGKMQTGEKFGNKVNITSTKPQIRIKFVADDSVKIYVDGSPMHTSGGIAESVADLTIAVGAHTIAFEVTESPGFSPCFLAYIIYDWDGTTERELARSNAASKVGIVTAVLPRHKAQCVTGAVTYKLQPTEICHSVVDMRTGKPVPFVSDYQGDGSVITLATTFYGLGDATPTTISPADSVLNLMADPAVSFG